MHDYVASSDALVEALQNGPLCLNHLLKPIFDGYTIGVGRTQKLCGTPDQTNDSIARENAVKHGLQQMVLAEVVQPGAPQPAHQS